MPVTFVKAAKEAEKAKPAATKAKSSPFKTKIIEGYDDEAKEYRQLLEWEKEEQKKLKNDERTARLAELKDMFRDIATEQADDDQTVYFGPSDEAVEVSVVSVVRSVEDPFALFETLGKETFINHASISLKTLDMLLSPEDKEKLIKSHRTGTRSVKAFNP